MRILLAGPLALAAACLMVLGGAVWLPPGVAGVNNIVLPIVLFPLLWALLFLYACLDRRLARAYLILSVVLAANMLALTVSGMR